jgi:hypothetical protein
MCHSGKLEPAAVRLLGAAIYEPELHILGNRVLCGHFINTLLWAGG